jgi:DUF2075 family protein/DNA replication protein DnaC
MSIPFEANFEISKHIFSRNSITELLKNKWVKSQFPLIYIISNETISEAYIGESTNALSRMINHLNNPDRIKLNTLHIIASDKFNKSATLDIENNLIKYLSADGKYRLQNGNSGLTLHNYYQKDIYYQIFKSIWNKLKNENLVKNNLKKIDNSDLFKYSPYKSLSEDQYNATIDILKVLNSRNDVQIIINGSSGTGKTILAIYLIKLLVTDYRNFDLNEEDVNNDEHVILIKSLKNKFKNPKIALVIPMTSLRKTLKNVFRSIKGLSSSMVIGPSDVMKDNYDILIIDEAHRLKRRKNITNYKSFDDNNRLLGLDDTGTELDWILKKSKNQIFFYDSAQSIKPSDIPKHNFDSLVKDYNLISLNSQMRVIGGNDYIAFVDNLLNCRTNVLKEQNNFKDYECILFQSLEKMVNKVSNLDNEYELCRLVAGFSWDWISRGNEHLYDIEIDNVKLKWNSQTEDWINMPNSKNEVGCIHTTQGYDLNYIGIIFGFEIDYDPINNEIFIIKENYKDKNGKNGINDDSILLQYIINIYKTLMYRGIKGTFIYACNKNLRDYLSKYIYTV